MGSFVESTNAYRRTVKIRRSGRHSAPSQVEKVAEKAGKAAPAMAIAGALMAMPQAHAAAKAPAAMVGEEIKIQIDAELTQKAAQ